MHLQLYIIPLYEGGIALSSYKYTTFLLRIRNISYIRCQTIYDCLSSYKYVNLSISSIKYIITWNCLNYSFVHYLSTQYITTIYESLTRLTSATFLQQLQLEHFFYLQMPCMGINFEGIFSPK